MTTATATRTTIRNPNLAPLTPDQLMRAVPAVFARGAHDSVSERYGFASTAQVLTALEAEGFVPVEATAYMRRDAGRMPFTKHMLRLRRAGSIKSLATVGDTIPQVVLINSHDRSSLFELMGGMFRLVCSNGLIVSTQEIIEPVRVRHNNRVVEEVMGQVQRIAADVGKVSSIIEDMARIKLSEKQQLAFARQALELRPGNATQRGAVQPEALLVARRTGDDGRDLWHTYNRVQENLMAGGLASVTANGRHTHTRPVLSINANVGINGGLWTLAMQAIDKARSK